MFSMGNWVNTQKEIIPNEYYNWQENNGRYLIIVRYHALILTCQVHDVYLEFFLE